MNMFEKLSKKEKKCEECGVTLGEILNYKDKKLCKKCFEKYSEIFEN